MGSRFCGEILLTAGIRCRIIVAALRIGAIQAGHQGFSLGFAAGNGSIGVGGAGATPVYVECIQAGIAGVIRSESLSAVKQLK